MGHSPFRAAPVPICPPPCACTPTTAFRSLLPAALIQGLRVSETALRKRKSRYGSLWNSKLMGIFVTDLAVRVTEANDTFLGLIGFSRAESDAGDILTANMATPDYIEGAQSRREDFQRTGRMGPLDRE